MLHGGRRAVGVAFAHVPHSSTAIVDDDLCGMAGVVIALPAIGGIEVTLRRWNSEQRLIVPDRFPMESVLARRRRHDPEIDSTTREVCASVDHVIRVAVRINREGQLLVGVSRQTRRMPAIVGPSPIDAVETLGRSDFVVEM